MAFGIKRSELADWKKNVREGRIDILTHYWLDERFPGSTSVTKVGCCDMEKLAAWGSQYGLRKEWIHKDPRHPHYDLFGEYQLKVLQQEGRWDQIEKFRL